MIISFQLSLGEFSRRKLCVSAILSPSLRPFPSSGPPVPPTQPAFMLLVAPTVWKALPICCVPVHVGALPPPVPAATCALWVLQS